MARKSINRSQVIREYLADHPTAMPKDVAAALSKEGIKCDTSLISQVKSKLNGTIGTRKKLKKKPSAAALAGARRVAAREASREADHEDISNRVAAARKAVATRQANEQARQATQQAKSISAHDLLNAKEFVNQIGGVEQAIEALKQLNQLQV